MSFTNFYKDTLLLFSDIASRKVTGLSLEDVKNHYKEAVEEIKTIKNMLENSIGENGPLVIFIDDLDRCENKNILNILSSIKEILNAKKTVFVLGIDMEKIERAWTLRYLGPNSKSNEGRDHVEKLFQLRAKLPAISKTELSEFIIQNSPLMPVNVADFLGKSVKNNPRKLKQTLNKLYFFLSLTKEEEIEIEDRFDVNQEKTQKQFTRRIKALVTASVLSICYPDMLQIVRLEPTSLIEASQFCVASNSFDNFKKEIPQLEHIVSNNRKTPNLNFCGQTMPVETVSHSCIDILNIVTQDDYRYYFLKTLASFYLNTDVSQDDKTPEDIKQIMKNLESEEIKGIVEILEGFVQRRWLL